jgi:hypothetical protein
MMTITWAPAKLAIQLAMLDLEGTPRADVICASRIRLVDCQGREQLIVPMRLMRAEETVANYLLVRRRDEKPSSIQRSSCARCGAGPAAAALAQRR